MQLTFLHGFSLCLRWWKIAKGKIYLTIYSSVHGKHDGASFESTMNLYISYKRFSKHLGFIFPVDHVRSRVWSPCYLEHGHLFEGKIVMQPTVPTSVLVDFSKTAYNSLWKLKCDECLYLRYDIPVAKRIEWFLYDGFIDLVLPRRAKK